MSDRKPLFAVSLLGALALLLASFIAVAEPWSNSLLAEDFRAQLKSDKGIYGKDDRIELYQATSAARRAAAATGALVYPQYLSPTRGGMHITGRGRLPLGQKMGLCAGERFAEQPSAAYCSGFLIDHDIFVTAGHCLGGKAPSCSDLTVVFGYELTSTGVPRLSFPRQDIYGCREVITRQLERRNGQRYDWAVIRLDRPVVGRKPVVVWGEEPPSKEELVVIGNPVGLPTKIATGGWIKQSDKREPVFLTDLDTYQGNSGSAIFTLSSIRRGDPEVVGVLVAGGADWDSPSRKAAACRRSMRCDEVSTSGGMAGRCTGEEVTKSSWVLDSVMDVIALDAQDSKPEPVEETRQSGGWLRNLFPGLF